MSGGAAECRRQTPCANQSCCTYTAKPHSAAAARAKAYTEWQGRGGVGYSTHPNQRSKRTFTAVEARPSTLTSPFASYEATTVAGLQAEDAHMSDRALPMLQMLRSTGAHHTCYTCAATHARHARTAQAHLCMHSQQAPRQLSAPEGGGGHVLDVAAAVLQGGLAGGCARLVPCAGHHCGGRHAECAVGAVLPHGRAAGQSERACWAGEPWGRAELSARRLQSLETGICEAHQHVRAGMQQHARVHQLSSNLARTDSRVRRWRHKQRACSAGARSRAES